MPSGYTFNESSTRRIAAVVRAVDRSKTDLRGYRGRRNSVGGTGTSTFLARITGHTVKKSLTIDVGGGGNQTIDVVFGYDAVEVAPDVSTFSYVEVDGGQQFSSTGAGGLPILWNWDEWIIDNGANVGGIDMTAGNYPVNFKPKPVGAAGVANTHDRDQPVNVFRKLDTLGNDFWFFTRPNEHDGECSP